MVSTTYEHILLPNQDSEREIDSDDGVVIYEGAARIGKSGVKADS